MDSPGIPLLRATHYRHFIVALGEVGVPVERLLREARLPSSAYDDPNATIPEVRAWGMVERASAAAGNDRLGHFVGDRYPVWQNEPELCRVLAEEPTLLASLRTFCRVVDTVATLARFGLEPVNGGCLFHVTSPAIEGSDDVQQYQLTLMTQLVQLAAGRSWRPPAVTTSMRDGRLLARTEMFADARLYRHRVRAGIFVPSEVLVRPIRIGSGTEQSMLAASLPDDFLSSMRSMLRAYLYDTRPGIDFAVELTGMSERTLQRRLAQHGLNYTTLLDQVRFELAREQLSDSDSKITDIAYDLGFSDVAHFSRAFHRWSGVSPRRFRQLSA